jgi:hypothetical protein
MHLHKLDIHDTLHGLSPAYRRPRDLDAIREEVETGTFMETSPYPPMHLPQWVRIHDELKTAVS